MPTPSPLSTTGTAAEGVFAATGAATVTAPVASATATGNVHVNQAGNVYDGPQLQLKLETFEGFFNDVRYHFLANGGQGKAERIDFVDNNVSVARIATYTTCKPEDYPGWMPAWLPDS